MADLLQQLHPATAAAQDLPEPAEIEADDVEGSALDELSDDEAAALLAETLEALEREG